MDLTRNERIALNMIARNDYQPVNGGRPASFADTGYVWSADLDAGRAGQYIAGRTLSGTTGSLANKGLIMTAGAGKESSIALTEAGFAAWDAAFPKEIA